MRGSSGRRQASVSARSALEGKQDRFLDEAYSFQVLLALLWAALVGLHFSKGTSLGNAIAMTADDARVATSCPAKTRVILDFLGRSETVPMGKVLSPEEITLSVQLVCDGRS